MQPQVQMQATVTTGQVVTKGQPVQAVPMGASAALEQTRAEDTKSAKGIAWGALSLKAKRPAAGAAAQTEQGGEDAAEQGKRRKTEPDAKPGAAKAAAAPPALAGLGDYGSDSDSGSDSDDRFEQCVGRKCIQLFKKKSLAAAGGDAALPTSALQCLFVSVTTRSAASFPPGVSLRSRFFGLPSVVL